MELLFKTHDSAAQWRIYRTDDGDIHAEVEFSEGDDAAGTVKLESRSSGLDFGVVERYLDPADPDNSPLGATINLWNMARFDPNGGPMFNGHPEIIVGVPGADPTVHAILHHSEVVVYMPNGVKPFVAPDGDTYYAYPLQ